MRKIVAMAIFLLSSMGLGQNPYPNIGLSLTQSDSGYTQNMNLISQYLAPCSKTLGCVGGSPSGIRYPNASAGLTPNSGVAPAEPYAQPVTTGSANFGPSTGQTSRNWIDFGHLYRFRENGTVTQIKVDVPSISGITGFYVSNCRTSTQADTTPALVDTISTSPNLAANLSVGVNTLSFSPGLNVQYGDYICGRVEWSGGATTQNLYTPASVSASGETASVYYVDNATPASSQYNYAGQTVASGVVMLVEGDMTPPVLACTGDSIDSGARTGYSFSDSYSSLSAGPIAYCDLVGQVMGVTTQNFGHAGFTIGQINSAFSAGPATAKAKYILLEGGINDLLEGSSIGPIETAWTSMLTAAKAAGEIPIILGITPFASSITTGQVAALTERDALNVWLAAQAATYGGFYVDPNPYVGTFWPGGPAGNFWQMIPAYAGTDLLHPSYPLGETRMAQVFLDGFAGANTLATTPSVLPSGQYYATVAGVNTYTATIPLLQTTTTIPLGTFLTINLPSGVAATNTGASTLAINGGTAYPIVQDATATPFVGGEFLTSSNYTLFFTGSFWQVISPLHSAAQLLNNRLYLTPDAVDRYDYLTNSATVVYGSGGTPYLVRETGTAVNLQEVTSAGQTQVNSLAITGTPFNASGCGTPTTIVGGSSGGSFHAAATSCTVTIAFTNSNTAPHGWACSGISDLTTNSDTSSWSQTATTTTTATLSGTAVIGDVIQFSCIAY